MNGFDDKVIQNFLSEAELTPGVGDHVSGQRPADVGAARAAINDINSTAIATRLMYLIAQSLTQQRLGVTLNASHAAHKQMITESLAKNWRIIRKEVLTAARHRA